MTTPNLIELAAGDHRRTADVPRGCDEAGRCGARFGGVRGFVETRPRRR